RYGPLTLLGLRRQRNGDEQVIDLYWRVEAGVEGDYTSTVQLFAGEEKLAQDDRPPGGVFIPTSAWLPGQIVQDRHLLPATPAPQRLLVGLYRVDAAGGFHFLAPPLEFPYPSP
ncbi:MAG: hypothetical protein D6790_18280, partial [Caldilineae bacterium]